MGQGLSRLACPVPAKGYEVFTGRRRHACVGFRLSLNSQDRDEHQYNEDGERLELEDVQKKNSWASCEGSSPMVQVPSGLLDEPLIKNTGTGEAVCQCISNHAVDVYTLPLPVFSCGLEGNQNLGNFMNLHENSEDLAEYMSGVHNDLNGQNAIAYVNIDSYELDSSDGEEDDTENQLSIAREEAGIFQETLDNMLPDLEIVTESFTELQSQFSALNHCLSRECCEEAGPMPLVRYFSIDSDLACSNNRTVKFSAEDQAVLKSDLNGADYETEQIKKVDVGVGTPMVMANELNASGVKTDQRNPLDLVVRPKIRKPNTANQLERDKFLRNVDEEESGSWRITEMAEVQCHAEHALRNSKEEMSSRMFFDSRVYRDHQRNTERGLSKSATAQEQKSVLDYCTSWDEFGYFSRHFSVSHKDEDSSECSDGECSAALPEYVTATEGDESSSDESWETVPPRKECEPGVQNSSSGVEEESKAFCFQGGKQTLEEEEIPWLHEELESSSDEDYNPVSDFMYPLFYLLGGNNNLEDDSSVGEDLDVEWRLLDEFGDGLGLAQAIPYMDSRFLTFMAIEEHLQQVMEVVLVHLESLGFDAEQAHPPATKETIDCLPQIVVTDDYDGQQQRCTICCSEYVKDEIVTELPCHHLFHKLCVTLWLQKSGTCPVCRHVLAPLFPEAVAATVSSLFDRDSASSVHSATEGSD